MSYQKRASTEPEPSAAEVLLVVALLVVVALCFAALWLDLGSDFARYVIAQLARAYPHQ